MKHLEISKGKGWFRRDGNMVELDKLDRQDMLQLIEDAEAEKFEMDPYNEELLHNRAHRVIYKNLEAKLNDFRSELNRFKIEAEKIYSEAIAHYDAKVPSEPKIEEQFEQTEFEEPDDSTSE